MELLDIDVTDAVPLTDEPSKIQFEEGESSKEDERGKRVVRWGAGASWAWDHGFLFKSMEDVLTFSPKTFFLREKQTYLFEDLFPIQQWFHLPVEEMAERIQGYQTILQNLVGDTALIPGFYYRTLIMWPLMLFGWEFFCELAYRFQNEFERIWREFADISLKVMTAFSMTDIKFMWCHDDICMTRGPIFNPKWYRENLYPYYEKIWEPLYKKNIKILFISDGNLDQVGDDVLAAGADGFLAEPTTNLELFIKKYKNEKIFVGNIDSRILLFGTKEDICKEVERCTHFGIDAPGYFYSVSNHLAWNIPIDNIKYYFEYCQKVGKRR